MPVYNAGKYLNESIESILNQTFRDFEFIIFNDASTDNSLEIIKSYDDSRIVLIDSPVNTGYVKHLNHGLELAKGEYIARMDADDIALPQRFEKECEILNNPKVILCGAAIEFIGTKTGDVIFPQNHREIVTNLLLYGNCIAHPAVMFRKSIVDRHQLRYDEALSPAEDYAMWLSMEGFGKFYNVKEVLLKYRVHETNESVLKKEIQDKSVIFSRNKFIQKNFKGYQIPDNAVSSIRQFIDGKAISLQSDDARYIGRFKASLIKSGTFDSEKINNVFSQNAYKIVSVHVSWQSFMNYLFIDQLHSSYRSYLKLIRSILVRR